MVGTKVREGVIYRASFFAFPANLRGGFTEQANYSGVLPTYASRLAGWGMPV